jgi:hypothetical protein
MKESLEDILKISTRILSVAIVSLTLFCSKLSQAQATPLELVVLEQNLENKPELFTGSAEEMGDDYENVIVTTAHNFGFENIQYLLSKGAFFTSEPIIIYAKNYTGKSNYFLEGQLVIPKNSYDRKKLLPLYLAEPRSPEISKHNPVSYQNNSISFFGAISNSQQLDTKVLHKSGNSGLALIGQNNLFIGTFFGFLNKEKPLAWILKQDGSSQLTTILVIDESVIMIPTDPNKEELDSAGNRIFYTLQSLANIDYKMNSDQSFLKAKASLEMAVKHIRPLKKKGVATLPRK